MTAAAAEAWAHGVLLQLTARMQQAAAGCNSVRGLMCKERWPAHLYIWFITNAVNVLMQSIQQKGKELLAIMLLVSTELWRKLRNTGLEATWHNATYTGLRQQQATERQPEHGQGGGEVGGGRGERSSPG